MCDAIIRDNGNAGCCYGSCRGKLGEIIYGAGRLDDEDTIRVEMAGTIWRGVPDPPHEGYIIVLRLPEGFGPEDGIWRLSEAARVRTGAAAKRHNPYRSPRYASRYDPGSPAHRFNVHDAPRIYLPVTVDEVLASLSWAWRQKFAPGTVADIIDRPRDLTRIRWQALLPADVECPDCHRPCHVALATS
jgi:hypothetical protein